LPRSLAAALLSAALLVAGCIKTETVYDVRDPLPAAALRQPGDEVGRKIAEATVRARWRIDLAAPGRLQATYDVGKHAATVDVAWTEQSFSITLVSSNNLLQQDGQIQRTYNVWVRSLEQSINDGLDFGSRKIGAAPPPMAPAALARVVVAPTPRGAPIRFGDSVEFRCPSPGTAIEFADGSARIFAGQRGGLDCAYTTEDGAAPVSETVFGRYGADAERALQRLWPLRVGNKVSFVARSGATLRQESFAVVRHEMIAVPAGTFDAFVIEDESLGNDNAAFVTTARQSEKITYWYAPEIGWYVKTTHRIETGAYVSGPDREAVRVGRR
jgi:hypothetical protein